MRGEDLKTVLEATLVVDTKTTGRLAGFRQRAASGRQLLFRAGKLYADLQVHHPTGSEMSVLTGQLVSDADLDSFAGLPIELSYEDGTLRPATTNEFGEFFLTCPRRGKATLEIDLDEDVRLAILLPEDALGSGVN